MFISNGEGGGVSRSLLAALLSTLVALQQSFGGCEPDCRISFSGLRSRSKAACCGRAKARPEWLACSLARLCLWLAYLHSRPYSGPRYAFALSHAYTTGLPALFLSLGSYLGHNPTRP